MASVEEGVGVGASYESLSRVADERTYNLLAAIDKAAADRVFAHATSSTLRGRGWGKEDASAVVLQCMVRRALARKEYTRLLFEQFEREEAEWEAQQRRFVLDGLDLIDSVKEKRAMEDERMATRNRLRVEEHAEALRVHTAEWRREPGSKESVLERVAAAKLIWERDTDSDVGSGAGDDDDRGGEEEFKDGLDASKSTSDSYEEAKDEIRESESPALSTTPPRDATVSATPVRIGAEESHEPALLRSAAVPCTRDTPAPGSSSNCEVVHESVSSVLGAGIAIDITQREGRKRAHNLLLQRLQVLSDGLVESLERRDSFEKRNTSLSSQVASLIAHLKFNPTPV